MTYKAVELEHRYDVPMHKVLKTLAKWLKENNVNGYIENIHTACDPYDETLYNTTLVWGN